MAFVPLTPVSVNFSYNYNETSKVVRTPAIKDLAGTAIDLTTWDSFSGLVIARVPFMDQAFYAIMQIDDADITANATGTLDIKLKQSQLQTRAFAGTHSLFVYGKPTSGDSNQDVASGNATFVVV